MEIYDEDIAKRFAAHPLQQQVQREVEARDVALREGRIKDADAHSDCIRALTTKINDDI